MKPDTNSPVMRHVTLFYWLALGLMAGVSSLVMSTPFTLGVLSGGILAIANFNGLRLSIQRAFSSGKMDNPKNGKKAALVGTFYIRLALMGILIYWLFTTGLVDPIGMAVGLSTVVIGILVFGIFMVFKPSSREAI